VCVGSTTAVHIRTSYAARHPHTLWSLLSLGITLEQKMIVVVPSGCVIICRCSFYRLAYVHAWTMNHNSRKAIVLYSYSTWYSTIKCGVTKFRKIEKLSLYMTLCTARLIIWSWSLCSSACFLASSINNCRIITGNIPEAGDDTIQGAMCLADCYMYSTVVYCRTFDIHRQRKNITIPEKIYIK